MSVQIRCVRVDASRPIARGSRAHQGHVLEELIRLIEVEGLAPPNSGGGLHTNLAERAIKLERNKRCCSEGLI